jgi:hypothetical protein
MLVEQEARTVREAVGVFNRPGDLQVAIDELLSSGFDRAELSLLASEHAVEEKLGHRMRRSTPARSDLRGRKSYPINLEIIEWKWNHVNLSFDRSAKQSLPNNEYSRPPRPPLNYFKRTTCSAQRVKAKAAEDIGAMRTEANNGRSAMGLVTPEIVAVTSGTSRRLPVRRRLKIAPRRPRCTEGRGAN